MGGSRAETLASSVASFSKGRLRHLFDPETSEPKPLNHWLVPAGPGYLSRPVATEAPDHPEPGSKLRNAPMQAVVDDMRQQQDFESVIKLKSLAITILFSPFSSI